MNVGVKPIIEVSLINLKFMYNVVQHVHRLNWVKKYK